MLKTFVEEAAALASIVLFVGMIAVWAQLIRGNHLKADTASTACAGRMPSAPLRGERNTTSARCPAAQLCLGRALRATHDVCSSRLIIALA